MINFVAIRARCREETNSMSTQNAPGKKHIEEKEVIKNREGSEKKEKERRKRKGLSDVDSGPSKLAPFGQPYTMHSG